MRITDILLPDAILIDVKAASKRQLLHVFAEHAARIAEIDERQVFDVLLQRERLGSTGVGSGIALPHGKLPGLPMIFGIFARLQQPIDFESIDGQPVDLACMLLGPPDSGAAHLKALARASRLFRDRELCEKIRGASSTDALYAVLQSSDQKEAA